jgi:hypothetical protein
MSGSRHGRTKRPGQALIGVGIAAALLWWRWATIAWALALFALAFGTRYEGFVALVPALTADYFGGRNVGAIIGALYTSVAFSVLVAPPGAGVAYDLRHSGGGWVGRAAREIDPACADLDEEERMRRAQE